MASLIEIKSHFDSQNSCWMISVEGELDVSCADKLKSEINKMLGEKIVDIKLDFSKLTYLDSTGIGVLVGALKKLKANDKTVHILNPKDNVRKIFDITGLNKIFIVS